MSASLRTETARSDGAGQLSQKSVGELVGQVSRDMSQLVRQEMQLARTELRQEAKETGQAAGAFGIAGFAGYMVLLFASIAGWWGLTTVMHQGWAALVIAGIWAVIAVILGVVGRDRAKRIHSPQQTAETVRQVPDAVRGRSRS
jgi:uncharacterized ion transporter superfamily protein YfcC